MVAQPGWQEVIKPYLESKISTSWVDPRDSTDYEEFFYKYTAAWGVAKAADEILKHIHSMVVEATRLEEKERGEVKNFSIGE
jgi:hypothetical protein